MNPFATAVFGHGRTPNDIMLVGEAPGAEEYRYSRPFIGPSGIEQDWYLAAHDLSSRFWYKTNVCKTFIPGNPDPTDDLISFWRGWLEDEIRECRPRLIIAVGKVAATWFLKVRRDMDVIHGIPFAVDVAGLRSIIIPIYHPAFGLRNPDIKGTIAWDYSIVAKAVHALSRMSHESFYKFYASQTPVNTIPNPTYLELSGDDFISAMAPYEDSLLGAPLEFGLDTEGWTDYPWPQWMQISPEPGISYILKSSRKRFDVAIRKLQSYVDLGSTVVAHQAGSPSGAMIDTQICRILGLELRDACLDDTMYMAYLLRVISRGLKPLSFRFAGMSMDNYEGIIGDIGRAKQIDYLRRALQFNWQKPDSYPERQSDGTWKIKSPKSMSSLIEGVLRDIDSGKILTDGEPTDPEKRWKKFPKRSRREIIGRIGVFPRGTLDDVDVNLANRYAGADSDGVLRIKPPLLRELNSLGLIPIYNQAMRFLSIVEDMQREGMPARRSKFDKLQTYILREKSKYQREINAINGRPINVNSPKQMIPALRRMSIMPRKKTKSGAASIGKKSLEYAKHFSRFVFLSFLIKEHGKIESTYCRPAIDIADNKGVDGSNDAHDQFVVNSFFQPAKLTSRRLSTEKPSLLNQPTRTRIGRMVRDCYVVPPGFEFGAWDFKAQELRVAVSISRDPFGIAMFTKCALCGAELPTKAKCRKDDKGVHSDPHTQAAARIFGIDYRDVNKFTHRLPAKTATFGVINGLSGPGLVDQFLMYIPPNPDGTHPWAKEDDCERLIHEILTKVYKGIGDEIKATERHLRACGHVRDIFADDQPGMLRYLPNGRSERARERAEAVRQGFNHEVQGTAAQMAQASAVWIDPRVRRMQRDGSRVHWHLLVHDEFILSYPPERREAVNKVVLAGMTQHYGVQLRVPVEADGEFAQSWGELKKD